MTAPRSDLESQLEAAGYVLLAAPAEPHAHLDKALTADLVANPGGDLIGAINGWIAHRETLTKADFVARAERAARMYLANGFTAIRTHVDLGVDIGTIAVEALIEVRDRMSGLVDIQIVGLTGRPSGGPAGADNRAVLRSSIALGLDVVGGCPHLDEDPVACTHDLLAIAAEYGLPIDLHTDETLDPSHLELELLADAVLASGFHHGATASHCVSLSMQTASVQQRVAEKVAAAGIGVVALPQTNLFLQARGMAVAPPRGLTATAALDAAGVNVCAGGDNLQDPFCTVGRADAFETAALMVMVGHDTPDVAYGRVSTKARAAIDMPANGDVLAVRASSLREAVATASSDRIVIRGGAVVAGVLPDGLASDKSNGAD